MPGIQINNLTKKFGNFVAIDDITLDIPDGSFCVFLGPSGCGKSTTLNIVAGLEELTSGDVIIADRNVNILPPHDRNIAMVFQSSLLYPHLTALENIRMSLKKSTITKENAQKAIDHAIDILEIKPVLDKKPGAMSGGQRQRVAMAKAIVRDPAAFLMDEPLAALDAALRQSLRSELVSLQKSLGTTTIFVTHDQVEAMTMGDQIVVMNEAKIEQVGTPDEIYNAPASRFVAGFIGSPPMNFFSGKVGSGKTPVLEGSFGKLTVPKHLRDKLPAVGKPATLGVRPQHISLSKTKKAGAIGVKIDVIENLGKEVVLIGDDAEGNPLRALVTPENRRKLGETCHFVPDLTQALLFTD